MSLLGLGVIRNHVPAVAIEFVIKSPERQIGVIFIPHKGALPIGHRAPGEFAPALVDVMLFGAQRATRKLLTGLGLDNELR